MEPVPSVERLNATHTFPCPYVFKVVGANSNAFVARALAAAEAETGAQSAHQVKETPAGRHVSVTLEVPVLSAEQVRAVYARLQALEGLVLLL